MTVEEQVVAYQQGQLSFDELYPSIEKLVYREANKWEIRGMDKEDIVSELMFALYEACERFDAEKGFKFSTFAVNHLRYRIREEWRKTTLPKYGSEWTFYSSESKLGNRFRGIYEAGLMKIHQDADKLVEEEALTEIIRKTYEKLTELEQSYVEDYLFNEMTLKEISDKYGTYPQHVKIRLQRSFEKVQYEIRRKRWEVCL